MSTATSSTKRLEHPAGEPPPSRGAWCEDRLAHAVDDFFLGRYDRGQHAAEGGPRGFPIAMDKVVGTKADAAFHGLEFIARKVKPLGIHRAGFVEALKHVRRLRKTLERLIDGGGPLALREITAQVDAAPAPG